MAPRRRRRLLQETRLPCCLRSAARSALYPYYGTAGPGASSPRGKPQCRAPTAPCGVQSSEYQLGASNGPTVLFLQKWIIKATTREVVEATPVAMMGPAKLSKMQLGHHRSWSPRRGGQVLWCSSDGEHRNLQQQLKCLYVLPCPPSSPNQVPPLHGIILLCFL